MNRTITFRTPAMLAATAILALGAAACGEDEDQKTGSGGGQTSTQQQQQPEPVAALSQLDGQTTDVALDAGFVKALGALKVTPGVVGDAELTEGTLKFPITGGSVKYFDPNGTVKPFVQGLVAHDGSGLSLTAGGKKVELENFKVDPGKSVLTGRVSVDGKVAAPEAPLFFLDGSTLQPLRTTDDGRAVLEGTTVELKAEAAELLNKTFGIQDLQEGLKIGVAKITVKGQPA